MARFHRWTRVHLVVCIAVLFVMGAALAACSFAPRLPEHAFDPRETARAAERLKQRLPPEIFANFTLFLYVDKAETGPLAQRMIVFRKAAGEGFEALHAWPVSTGREDVEADAHGKPETTATPQGFFTLDPKRMYASYVSSQWDESMPYAMFLSSPAGGRSTGLAIHAAAGRGVDLIGRRASAGCVRLAPENARALFELVRAQYAGRVPGLSRESANARASATLEREGNGGFKKENGYSVIVVIDDYGSPAYASTERAFAVD